MKREDRSGRKRTIHACVCHGMGFSWYRTGGSLSILSIVTNTICPLFLRFPCGIIVKVLSKSNVAPVPEPRLLEINIHKTTTHENFSLIEKFYATGDVPELMLEQSGDAVSLVQSTQPFLHYESTHGTTTAIHETGGFVPGNVLKTHVSLHQCKVRLLLVPDVRTNLV